MKVTGKKIWIVGAARSGLAAAKLLHQNGAKLFVTDAAKIEESTKKSLEELSIPYEEEGHSIGKLLADADLVVLSPSIPLDKPLPLAARRAGIPVVSEIEVASWFINESSLIVGITGTNGKSTTTHYAAQLFNLAQRNSVACGNYGRALSDALLDPAKYNAFIVELSSYQLETTFSLRPHVSVFLNLQNDHMARYGVMGEYFKAKWRLILATRADGIAVVDHAVFQRALAAGVAMPECRILISYGFLEQSQATLVMESLKCPKRADFNPTIGIHRQQAYLSYGALDQLPFELLIEHPLTHTWLTRTSSDKDSFMAKVLPDDTGGDPLTIEVEQPVLPGDHNQVNILAASLPALHLGVHPNIVRAQWQSKSSVYQHLAHRLEEVGKAQTFRRSSEERVAVRIVNDSKATNVESTLVAVSSFKNGIRLLLGGEPKGDSYALLLPYIGRNVVRVYPFGKAAPLICQQLASIGDQLAPASGQMAEAAQRALDEAQTDDIILLSPACASFDEFKNFEHRGDSFRHWAFQRL